MEKLINKMLPRLPELVRRAICGDPVAIATLAALGITAGAYAVTQAVKTRKGKA